MLVEIMIEDGIGFKLSIPQVPFPYATGVVVGDGAHEMGGVSER